MIDNPAGYGLGWIESPEDPRDFPIADAFDAFGVDAADPLPAAFRAPAPRPPILNQGDSPMCVAFSAEAEQRWFDLRDSGPVDLDAPLFFKRIGGTKDGAVIRNALAERLKTGYPPVGDPGAAGAHRITAYYAVPIEREAMCAAIKAFGPIVVGTSWYRSWFAPTAAGDLPSPDVRVGGHAFEGDGWDPEGLWGVQTWGIGWGVQGRFRIPWSQLHYLREAWKAVDQRTAQPRFRVQVSGGHAHPTWLFADADTASHKSAPIYSAGLTAIRRKVDGVWWYQVKSASVPAWVGKWFQAQPEPRMTVEVLP